MLDGSDQLLVPGHLANSAQNRFYELFYEDDLSPFVLGFPNIFCLELTKAHRTPQT